MLNIETHAQLRQSNLKILKLICQKKDDINIAMSFFPRIHCLFRPTDF